MRVYVPGTLVGLTSAHRAGEIGPVTGYAVTPALREWYADGDDEELEYAAMTQAARASIGLLAREGGPPRRVVIACEVAAARGSGAFEPGDARLDLDTVVPWSAVVAVHVDSPEAAEVVAEATQFWDAAQNGDQDAVFAVDACEGEELQWYATQEVPDLLTRQGPAEEQAPERS